MTHRVTCDRCGSISEYDDKSIWEGNREHEDIECLCVEISSVAHLQTLLR